MEINYECDCSRDKIEKVIISLGKKRNSGYNRGRRTGRNSMPFL